MAVAMDVGEVFERQGDDPSRWFARHANIEDAGFGFEGDVALQDQPGSGRKVLQVFRQLPQVADQPDPDAPASKVRLGNDGEAEAGGIHRG